MDEMELLWKTYDDNRQYARHHENQRATASNITMIVSAGILGLITIDKELSLTDLPLTIFLTLLGLFGAAFSAKHYERVRLHLNRSEECLKKLGELLPAAEIEQLKKSANARTAARFPKLTKFQLNRFWIVLHLFLALVGGAIFLIILAPYIRLGLTRLFL